MDELDLQPDDFINARERFAPPKSLEPKVDTLISSVVGKKVYTTDPRVLKLIARYKSRKKDDDEPDNFLKNPKFIQDLKHELNQSL